MKVDKTIFNIVIANITDVKADAVVNSTNRALIKGGGVCGAIYNAAGNDILTAALKPYAPLEDGESILTPAYNMKNTSYIIHTLTPRYNLLTRNYRADLIKSQNFSKCIISVFKLAIEKPDIHSIAIPCLGTGNHNWPLDLSVKLTIDTINWLFDSNNKYGRQIKEIIIVCHNCQQCKFYNNYLNEA